MSLLDAYATGLHALPPLAADAVRYANGLILLAVLLVPLERVAALRRQPVRRPGLRTDIGWYFLTSLLPGRLLALPLAALAWLAPHVMPAALLAATGALPDGLRLALALVVAECGSYAAHRWLHRSAWGWRVHAIHHSARQMDWLVNTRAHPLDLLAMRGAGYLPLYLLGLARPGGAQVDWVPLAALLLASGWGYLIHANVRWRFGWLAHVVATPAFHHAHHALRPASADHRHGNYAALLPVLDRVFGTLRREAPESANDRWPAAYGIDEPMPPDLAGQLLWPWMSAGRPQAHPGGMRGAGSASPLHEPPRGAATGADEPAQAR